jgi:hypothetical protein
MNLSFTTQLFWRFKDDSFTEEQSVHRNWTVGPNGGPYRMRLPQFEAAPAQLRLDLTDRPAVLTLSSITLLNNRAERIWALDLRESRDLAVVGMSIAPVPSGNGAIVTVSDTDPAILLPLDRAILSQITSGSTLEIEMSSGAEGSAIPGSEAAAGQEPVPIPFTATSAPRMYLELLERCLTRLLIPDSCLNNVSGFNFAARLEGKDWPSEAETMIGLKRLESLEACAATVLGENVPGDFVEAGVWRGGASILLRAVLRAYGDPERCVWLADSFEGMPVPDAMNYPADGRDLLYLHNDHLAVSVETVKRNFAKYGLLDERVRFLTGWFRDSLPNAPIDRISLLRLDGDLYESTMDILRNLYHKVSPGGYVIVDDYGALDSCRAAIQDFRTHNDIAQPIVSIDWTGVYWRKRLKLL